MATASAPGKRKADEVKVGTSASSSSGQHTGLKATCFRYVVQGKRPALLVGGGEKTKQMGLGDVSIDCAEDSFLQFMLKQRVQMYSNYHCDNPSVKALAPAVESNADFLTEFQEWLSYESVPGQAWEKSYPDLYVFYFTGCADERGDIIVGGSQGSPSKGSPSKKSSGAKEQTISLLDIERAWEDFKAANLVRVLSYEEYRDTYYTKSKPPMTRAQLEKDLNSAPMGQVQPLLWIILDSDNSNQWVDYGYSRNFRDIVIQGFTDSATAPLHVVVKAWGQLQDGSIDNRQFGSFLKAMGGSWHSPKVYAMPGFKFPAWSVPEFEELFEMLVHKSTDKKKSWIFERKDDPTKPSGYSLVPKEQPVTMYQIQLAQGRKQVLAQSFSVLQAEVEEAIHALDNLRLLFADGDMRPNKDNRNNISTLQAQDSAFCAEKLLFVLHTLKIYLYTPRVCTSALRALWALTYSEEVRSELLSPVVVQLLLKVTGLHIHDPVICLYATGVISRCAWNLKIWRANGKILNNAWNRLLEFLLLHPAEEELVRLVGVSLSALSVEKGKDAFGFVFPVMCDLIEFYLGNADTLYSLLGCVLQIVASNVPSSPDDCLRVFALFLQVLEKHPHNSQMCRQCALGFIKLSTNDRPKNILLQTPQLFTLFLTLLTQALQNFLKKDPYVIWQLISCLLNFLKSNPAQTKKLLFTHPKCRIIHDCARDFVEDEQDYNGGGEYAEILKQQVRDFLKIFQSEKSLMRQLRIAEKRKEKL
ncbi:unnamed protein product [Amoebophrya sp. A25]|nr:unnamed protein product [Amoebophrya sp. A25]|eukprot:GSA25T00007902001.1